METETETLKIYSSYTEAQKRATKKYREQNKEKVNAQRKKYYDERKANDPNFLLYKREKAKEYYNKNKVEKTDIDVCEEKKDNVEDLTLYIPAIIETLKNIDIIDDDTICEELLNPLTIEEPKTPKTRKPRLKKEKTIRENLKPEDLEDIKLELLKSLDVVDIVYSEPPIPMEENIVKKVKKQKVKRNLEE